MRLPEQLCFKKYDKAYCYSDFIQVKMYTQRGQFGVLVFIKAGSRVDISLLRFETAGIQLIK